MHGLQGKLVNVLSCRLGDVGGERGVVVAWAFCVDGDCSGERVVWRWPLNTRSCFCTADDGEKSSYWYCETQTGESADCVDEHESQGDSHRGMADGVANWFVKLMSATDLFLWARKTQKKVARWVWGFHIDFRIQPEKVVEKLVLQIENWFCGWNSRLVCFWYVIKFSTGGWDFTNWYIVILGLYFFFYKNILYNKRIFCIMNNE